MTPLHHITGVGVKDSECGFCGTALEHLSEDATHVPCEGEHLHFSLVNNFYARCARCKLLHTWQLAPAHVGVAHAARHLYHYQRAHGPPA